MPISTANTLLKYGVLQVETATVVGTITGAGNATFTVTGSGISGSPLAVSVAVLLGDSPAVVASKAADAINLTAAITALYTAQAIGALVILTRKAPAANDATLNVAFTNGTCTGLTPNATSANTTAGVALANLVNIINYPDLGSAPSKLDTTDLTQPVFKTNMLGLQEAPDVTFECNYDETAYQTIVGLTGSYFFQLLFGTADGKFEWTGQVGVYANAGGVDEVRKMTVVTSVTTPIVFTAT